MNVSKYDQLETARQNVYRAFDMMIEQGIETLCEKMLSGEIDSAPFYSSEFIGDDADDELYAVAFNAIHDKIESYDRDEFVRMFAFWVTLTLSKHMVEKGLWKRVGQLEKEKEQLREEKERLRLLNAHIGAWHKRSEDQS